MAKTNKELEYKLKDYPQTKHNMLQHSVFHDFLSRATDEQLAFCEDFFDAKMRLRTLKYEGASYHPFTHNFRSKLAQFSDNFNWK